MLRTYILLCLGCVAVSTAVVIMEAYALLALQFCDGEDLMSLYWSTWTMIQVGSLIAMMGIILALGHTLRNRKHPCVQLLPIPIPKNRRTEQDRTEQNMTRPNVLLADPGRLL